jgi:hypothetical protein
MPEPNLSAPLQADPSAPVSPPPGPGVWQLDITHSASFWRELGIPAVVGTKSATRLIPDGARVRVSGATGEVQVLP